MKKSLLIAPLFVLASLPAIAQMNQDANSTPSNNSQRKCSDILNKYT